MKHRGFTLIELVIVIAILGIIAAIGGLVLYQSFRAGFTSRDLIEASWQNRLALQRITRELRETTSMNNNSNANVLRFSDINNNNVRYRRSSNYLQRRQGSGSWRNLADGVSSLSFSYVDQNGNLLSVPLNTNATNVRCINIATTITKSSKTVTLKTTVCPRNLL